MLLQAITDGDKGEIMTSAFVHGGSYSYNYIVGKSGGEKFSKFTLFKYLVNSIRL